MHQRLIDHPEELCDLRRPCLIRFEGDNGGIITLRQVRISDVRTDVETPYLLVEGGIRILLERLVEVDGRSTSGAV